MDGDCFSPGGRRDAAPAVDAGGDPGRLLCLFLFVRWGGRDFVLCHWPRVGRLRGRFHSHSAALLVFAVRQLPISGLIINFLLGLSPIRHRHFLLGTAFGILPELWDETEASDGETKALPSGTS